MTANMSTSSLLEKPNKQRLFLDIDGRDVALVFAVFVISQLLAVFFTYAISNKDASLCLGSVLFISESLTALTYLFFLYKTELLSLIRVDASLLKKSALYLSIIVPTTLVVDFLVKYLMTQLGLPIFYQEIEMLFPLYSFQMPMFYLVGFTMVILCPICEEVLFRGVFQNYLGKYFGQFFGIGLSSTLFTLMHCDSAQGLLNIQFLMPGLILSYSLGYCFYKTKSLVPCVLIHSSINLVCFIEVILDKIF